MRADGRLGLGASAASGLCALDGRGDWRSMTPPLGNVNSRGREYWGVSAYRYRDHRGRSCPSRVTPRSRGVGNRTGWPRSVFAFRNTTAADSWLSPYPEKALSLLLEAFNQPVEPRLRETGQGEGTVRFSRRNRHVFFAMPAPGAAPPVGGAWPAIVGGARSS